MTKPASWLDDAAQAAPKWTFARVNSLQGTGVKVVGQLDVSYVHFERE